MANYTLCFVQRCITRNVLNSGASKHVKLLLKFSRQYTSALFVSGGKAMDVFSYVTPYLDMDNRLADMEKLQRDLTSRGLKISAEEIKQMWNFHKYMNHDRSRLEARVNSLVVEMKHLSVKNNLTKEEELKLTKLKLQYKVMKSDLQYIKKASWYVSENIIEKLLKLPIEVSEKTPHESYVVLKRSNTSKKFINLKDKKSHIEIGRNLGLLEYKNPMQYYLCNDAALFELGLLNYAGSVLSGADMIRVAGADFSRSIVVEGSGLNHEDPFDAFVIDGHSDIPKDSPNQMHLVGGASLISFLAMHTKQIISPNYFPVKYFSTGRQYTPLAPGITPTGLFTVCQASAAHAFVMVKNMNSNEFQTHFTKLLNTVHQLYDNICHHYRVVMRPASELRPWESMRVSYELWSPFLNHYVEVGHISVSGSYFCKRLLIVYQTPSGREFPVVISGTVLSVPRLLGCLLEHTPNEFVIPPKILKHMP